MILRDPPPFSDLSEGARIEANALACAGESVYWIVVALHEDALQVHVRPRRLSEDVEMHVVESQLCPQPGHFDAN
jgi:hypothetical protein